MRFSRSLETVTTRPPCSCARYEATNMNLPETYMHYERSKCDYQMSNATNFPLHHIASLAQEDIVSSHFFLKQEGEKGKKSFYRLPRFSLWGNDSALPVKEGRSFVPACPKISRVIFFPTNPSRQLPPIPLPTFEAVKAEQPQPEEDSLNA